MFQHTFDKSMVDVKAAMDAQEAITLVDVRLAHEYEDGHIPTAVLLPLNELDTKAETVLKDKDAVLYVYCRSGQRSSKAVRVLRKKGYRNVYNIGGILHWTYEIERGM